MTPLVIPDTCSIINFGVIDRISLLTELLAGRGRWTQAVPSEPNGTCVEMAATATAEYTVIVYGAAVIRGRRER